MNIILITAIFSLVLALILGLALGFFKEIFAVETDPLAGQIRAILPGANCGACGYPGCDGYAAAIAGKTAEINKCSPGGQSVAEKLSALAGGVADVKPVVAVLACSGTSDKSRLKGSYTGVKTCRAAKISVGSIKGCTWGCQGFGDCVKVCKFGAMHMENGIPVINADKCTGCKACVIECPMNIIHALPRDLKGAKTICSNLNVNKAMVGKNCKAGCIKCELCIKSCPEKCMKMVNGIPVIDYSKCTSCEVCVKVCPPKVLHILEKEIIVSHK